jgi:hypothetical protein
VLVPRAGEISLHNRPVQGVGHTALTYDPGVYQVVRRELQQASQAWDTRRAAVDLSAP